MDTSIRPEFAAEAAEDTEKRHLGVLRVLGGEERAGDDSEPSIKWHWFTRVSTSARSKDFP